jgi:hypothetical protein
VSAFDEPPAFEEPAWSAAPEPQQTAVPAGADWVGRVQHEWALVKKVCKQKSPSAAALLTHANPVGADQGAEEGGLPILVVEALHKFHYEKLRTPKIREVVEWSVEQVLGAPVRLRVVLTSGGGNGGNGANGAPIPSSPGPGGPQSGAMLREVRAVEPQLSAYTQRSPGAANGIGANGHASPAVETGHLGGQGPRLSGSNGSVPVPTSVTSTSNGQHPTVPNALPPAAKPRQSLEDQARADAVVQEVQRSLGAELIEVRPTEDEAD